MKAAAAILLHGGDPIGEPFLATRSQLVREAWMAVAIQAGRMRADG